MTALCVALFLLAALLVAWSYFAYPALARRLGSREPQPPDPGEFTGGVEVLVSAADEEGVIADRIRNLLDQEAAGPYRISIGCDGSADQTAERARAGNEGTGSTGASAAEVRVIEFPSRRGKASVLNDLIAGSVAEVLVFTDANTRFDPHAVRRLTRAFADPSVGAVCGRLLLESPVGSHRTPESEFWDRETKLKDAEGRLGVCLGANGAIYAARRSEIVPLPADTTSMDDFLIPVRIAGRGKRVVFAGDAVAREEAGRDIRAEMSRRFRIGIGAGQTLRRETWLWNVHRHPRLFLAFLSRKVARWLAPVVVFLSALAALLSDSPLWRLAAAAVLLLAAGLLFGTWARPRVFGIPGKLYYFAMINLALSCGVIAGLLGYSRPVWKTAR